MLALQNSPVHQVFHLSLKNRDELARRLRKRALKDNRLDDANDAVIAQRLALYDEDTKPMLEYYDNGLILGKLKVLKYVFLSHRR